MRAEVGKLFVFEGPDGSGKTTLARSFAEALTSRGETCVSIAFPGTTARTLGAWVYQLHHSHERELTSLAPASLQLLHVAAHIDTLESRLLPALESGKTVVLDRFWWSTWVYGSAAGVPARALRSMIRLEQIFWKSIRPDAVFLVSRAHEPSAIGDAHAQALDREYERIAFRERSTQPIHRVSNDGTVADAVSRVVEMATSTRSVSIARDTRHRRRNKKQTSGTLPFTHPPAIRASRPKPSPVYETYWRFAAERQEVYFRRLSGSPPPWTDDSILAGNKFTNAYRAADRVSQYLIRKVIYTGEQTPQEVFFRTILFKFFNKIETWELLEQALGHVSYSYFSPERYDRVLESARRSGEAIYSGAYIMPTGGKSFPGGPKHRMHLHLLERMMTDELPARVFDARDMSTVFRLLRSYPTIGDFLAYQYATDLNYSALMTHSEAEFVVPGPGARDGLRKCFVDPSGLSESDLIRYVAERQKEEFGRLGLAFRTLWGRDLQLIDCQNLFCEVDKYARARHPEISGVTGRTRIKQRFRPGRALGSPWYPPKWGLNDKIQEQLGGPSSISRPR